MAFDFVITADRSMMTNHRGKEFLGFMTTAPPVGLHPLLWAWISMPKPKVDIYGRPREAPYGLRKIEAALQDAGFSAAIVDPDHVKRYVESAKAVLVGHHDYFAFNSPSVEYWLLTGEEPVNRRSFLSFMQKLAEYKRRLNPRLRIIVGGPAAWQWLYAQDYIGRYLVDTIVEGEGEKVVVELAKRVMDGAPLPRFILVGPQDSPDVHEIPTIRGASINGLVEVMRGCPRGCSFCSVTLRKLRFIPLEMIEVELRVNAESDTNGCILHSEDVPLYGGKGVTPRFEALQKLHELVTKYFSEYSWSHAALATLLHGEKTERLVSRYSQLVLSSGMDYLGFQTGIETGSPRLAAKVMPAKAAPFRPGAWPDVVREVMPLLHDSFFIPAATVILGLPGETQDDVVKTIELVEDLRPYRSIIVPMFFVPMGVLRREDWFTSVNFTYEHAELVLATLRHTVYWSREILTRFYMRRARYAPARLLLLLFLNRAEQFAATLTPEKVLEYVERSKEKMRRRYGGAEARIREKVLARILRKQ